MNLQKLLAENMVRFGTKNLTEQSHKTLLNEVVKPGGLVEDQPRLVLNYIGGAETAIKTALASYSKPNVYNAAILAVGAGFANIAAKTKGLRFDQKSVLKGEYSGIIGFLASSESDNFAYSDKKLEEKAVKALIQSCNFTYDQKAVSVYPGPRGGVATLGKVENSEVIDNGFQRVTNYVSLISYLNRFNIGNVIFGDFTQYNLSSMLDSNNYVNLLNAQVATNAIYVYTAKTNISGVANKEINTTTQGATAPIDKNYDVSFDQGKSAVPTNDSEVAKAVADAIAMFPDENITNLSIVSSASPEYGAIKKVPGWQKSYSKGITGTGNPGNGTDDASKNIKLAYDRGVNFVAAINAGLTAQGKSEIQGYNINWQISDTGGILVPGRYAKVLWSKAGTLGKVVTNLDNTGKAGTTTSGKETYTIYQHVFTPVS